MLKNIAGYSNISAENFVKQFTENELKELKLAVQLELNQIARAKALARLKK